MCMFEWEGQFQWVGLIVQWCIFIYKLVSCDDLWLMCLSDLVGVCIGVVCELVVDCQLQVVGLWFGIELEQGLDDVINVCKLLVGCMEFIILLDWVVVWNLCQLYLFYEMLLLVMEYDMSKFYWYGLCIDIDLVLVCWLQGVLDVFKCDGCYEWLCQCCFC